MGTGFENSPGKDFVRSYWNTPLLEYIRGEAGAKYNYLGFPGKDALDIVLWREMIDYVVAFEYPKAVADVETALIKMGIDHIVYSGNMEETVFNGIDMGGKDFRHDRIITLYNLDFTNSITGRIRGRGRTLRFEALRNLMTLQRNQYIINNGRDVFILLITVRAEYHTGHVKAYLRSDLSREVEKIVSEYKSAEISSTARFGRNAEVLRAFILDRMHSYLESHQISSVFLPTVEYWGGKNSQSPMMHIMAVCKQNEVGTTTTKSIQKRSDLFQLERLRVEQDSLHRYTSESQTERVAINAVDLLKRYGNEIFNN